MPLLFRRQTVFPHQSVDIGSGQACVIGRCRDVAAVATEDGRNVASLEVTEPDVTGLLERSVDRNFRQTGLNFFRPANHRLEGLVRSEDERSIDEISQLSDVSRP